MIVRLAVRRLGERMLSRRAGRITPETGIPTGGKEGAAGMELSRKERATTVIESVGGKG